MRAIEITEGDRDRFMEYVWPEPMSGCWLWSGFISGTHGGFQMPAGGRPAHRVSWVLHRGPIPGELWVLHHCDNRLCVNPDHLYLGTHRDNMDDMKRRKRARGGKGTKNGAAKLTDDAVRWIHGCGLTNAAAAAALGVSETAVWQVRRGLTWKHVSPQAAPRDTKGKTGGAE